MVKKIFIGILIGIVALILIALISIPFFVKDYIESNSEELVGRKMTIDKISINYFNGGIRVKEFKIFEKDQETLFAGFNELYARINFWDLFSRKYTVNKLELSRPNVNIIVFENQFNFDDLVTYLDTSKSEVEEPEKDFVWVINDISVNNGIVTYHDEMFGNSIEIEDLNILTPAIAYNSDTIVSDIDLKVKSGGSLNMELFFDLINNQLNAQANLQKLNIEPLIAPMKEFMEIGQLNGELSHELSLALNLNEGTDIALKGNLELGELKLFNDKNEKLLAFDNFSLVIDSLNVKHDLYNVSTVNLDNPYLLFELYDDGDNWSVLFPEKDTTITKDTPGPNVLEESYNVFILLAHYIRDIAKSYTTSKYSFNSFEMTGGLFEYHDFTLHERFSYTVSEMNINANNIDSDADSVRFDISLLLNEESEGRAEIIIDPADYNNMVINYDITNTSLAEITPYSIYHTSYPIHKALLNYSSRTTIIQGIIDSDNKITITDFKFGPKKHSPTALKLPVKLAVALLKDLDGNINLDIPVEGDLHNPKFRIGKAVWNILKNLILKVATSPYKLLANAFGANEEDLKEFRYDYLENGVGTDQKKSLDALAKILQNKEELNIKFIQIVDTLREANAFAMLEARKMYYAQKIANKKIENIDFTEEVLSEVKNISTRDSLFVYWLDETLLLDNRQIPVQKKCRILIGNKKVMDHAASLAKTREQNISEYLQNEYGIVVDRFLFGNAEDIREVLQEDTSLHPGRPLFVVKFTEN